MGNEKQEKYERCRYISHLAKETHLAVRVLTELEADSNSFSSSKGTPSVLRTEDVSKEARDPVNTGHLYIPFEAAVFPGSFSSSS
jgi:hypothetical protein